MIAKRTKLITHRRTVMNWGRHYLNEAMKHSGEDLGGLGIGIGKHYYTSRPIGAVTAHGYARDHVELIRMSKGLDGNEAVHQFLNDHCRRQALKRRKILGIRMILSTKPEVVQELLAHKVDIDRLLVRAVEDTVDRFVQNFYPGDRLGYILGVHHDAITKPKKGLQLPHVHAHVMFLPQTEKGLRLSLSNHNSPLRDGKFHQVLNEFSAIYRTMVIKHMHHWRPPIPVTEPSPDWIALCNFCAAHVTLQAAERTQPPESLPAEFSDFIRKTGPEDLRTIVFRNEAFRIQRDDPGVAPQHFLKAAGDQYREQMKNLCRHVDSQQQSPVDDQSRTDRHSKIWNFGFLKGIQLSKPNRRRESRKAVIDQLFQGLENRRFSRHVGVLGDCAILEFLLKLACTGPRRLPEWFHQLEDLRLERRPMPNQRYYQPAWHPPDPEVPKIAPSVKQPAQVIAKPSKTQSMAGPDIT